MLRLEHEVAVEKPEHRTDGRAEKVKLGWGGHAEFVGFICIGKVVRFGYREKCMSNS